MNELADNQRVLVNSPMSRWRPVISTQALSWDFLIASSITKTVGSSAASANLQMI